MKKYLILSILFLFISIVHGETDNFSDYNNIIRDVFKLQCTSESENVNNLKFKKDVGNFTFKNGNFYLLTEINNCNKCLLFVGNGSFTFVPPSVVEKNQLKRFFGCDTFYHEFEKLFFILNDSTIENISQDIEFNPIESNSELTKIIENFVDFISYRTKDKLYNDFMNVFLDNKKSGYFYSQFYTDKKAPFAFEINPRKFEQVRFYQKGDYRSYYHEMEVVCQFPRMYMNKNEVFHRYHVSDYNIETSIAEAGFPSDKIVYSGVSKMNLKFDFPAQKWINLFIDSEIQIDSVKFENKFVEFVQPDETGYIYINTGLEEKNANFYQLTVYYSSDNFLSKLQGGWISINDSQDWFPQYISERYSNYELTYSFPEKMNLISVGDKIYEKVENNIKESKWSTQKPVRYATFNIGYFDMIEDSLENLPKVKILKSNSILNTIGTDTKYDLVNDVLYSTKLFSYILGSRNVEHFYISDIPSLVGYAYPDFILLSSLTYNFYSNEGYHEIYRAHEVAHQWWGIGVSYESYHDNWLIEGLANYFGLWYMQAYMKNPEKVNKILTEWKEDIFNNRKYLIKDKLDSAPIYLGYRTSSSQTPEDYSVLIYKKGAWIIHMLRCMFLDLNTMNEDKFLGTMKSFYQLNEGGEISTEKFQNHFETYLHTDLDWFFDEWVYKTEIPSYRYSYKIDKLTNGKYRLNFKFKIENVNANFKMPIPIEIKYKNNQLSRVTQIVKGNDAEFFFDLPLEPNEVKVNIFESVLGDFKEVKWKKME